MSAKKQIAVALWSDWGVAIQTQTEIIRLWAEYLTKEKVNIIRQWSFTPMFGKPYKYTEFTWRIPLFVATPVFSLYTQKQWITANSTTNMLSEKPTVTIIHPNSETYLRLTSIVSCNSLTFILPIKTLTHLKKDLRYYINLLRKYTALDTESDSFIPNNLIDFKSFHNFLNLSKNFQSDPSIQKVLSQIFATEKTFCFTVAGLTFEKSANCNGTLIVRNHDTQIIANRLLLELLLTSRNLVNAFYEEAIKHIILAY